MRLNSYLMTVAGVVLGGGFALGWGCGGSGTSEFDGGSGDGSAADGAADGNAFGDTRVCDNLECKQVSCMGTAKTTLSGTVFDPAGTTPLYNAIVYVPNKPVLPFPAGVTCDRCGGLATGAPLVSTLTGPDGKFVLENVPADTAFELVIQIGKWRRRVMIPPVAKCVDTPLRGTDTRLPRNKAEGDIPQMAIATGRADPLQCLLLKMGVDAAEFTRQAGDGRVHYFVENGENLDPDAGPSSDLWSSLPTLKKYDLVFLPCAPPPMAMPTTATQNIIDYTSAGGRLFATHYSYVWIAGAQAPFPSTGTWNPDQAYLDAITGYVDTSFPKGKDFADWLKNVGASATYGELPIVDGRHDLDAVNVATSRKWIGLNTAGGNTSPNSVQHMTFNTPINAALDDAGDPLQCGRVVYSDFHVSANAVADAGAGQPTPAFPGGCIPGSLSPTEKALEFMIFDLSSCIQKDDAKPKPPK